MKITNFLQPNVRFLNSIDSIIERFELSSGVEKVDFCIQNHIKFCADAYAPRKIWRKLQFEESNILSISESDEVMTSAWLALFRVSDDILKYLDKLNIRGKVPANFEINNESPEVQKAVTLVAEYLKSYCVTSQGFSVKGIYIQSPNLITLGYDPDYNCYVGLHADFCDELPTKDVEIARKRACINLGSEARSFLFYNLTARDMARVAECDLALSVDEIFRQFVKKYPNYPIIKLRIEPGEGYIAPTDAIIHEGCTLNMESPDRSLHILGHFSADKIKCILVNVFDT